jgi:dienelactone hydrolase
MEKRDVSTVSSVGGGALPAPTGEFAVGVESLRVVDRGRVDVLGGKGFRELMVDVRYPGRWAEGERVRQFSAGVAGVFGELAGVGRYGVAEGEFAWEETVTHGYRGVPVRDGTWPVVVYSPGLGDSRGWNAGMVDDLVSRGFVVVAVDHPYDSAGVEFPGGRVERSVLFGAGVSPEAVRVALAARVADLGFVVGQLPHIAGRYRMDPRRLAVLGHGAGGAAGMQLAAEEARVGAAVNLDGGLGSGADGESGELLEVARGGLGKPFLLVGSGKWKESWRAVMRCSEGAHSALTAPHAVHSSFTDAESLLRGDPYGLVGWNRTVVADFLRRALR